MSKEREKVTILTLRNLKKREEKAVLITAYDYPMATFADQSGVDVILVGDSGGMTMLGYKTTLPITMDEMIIFSKAVIRAVKHAFVIGDMPYMSYQPSNELAILNAGQFMRVGCDAVKCEGGKRMIPRVKAMINAGIPVMGHLGLTPQNIAQLGGYRVQGKTYESYKRLLEDALALQEAGIFALILEAMPGESAGKIREHLQIPVYGIGAGNKLDGQIVVIHDILGMFVGKKPKFVKQYCELGKLICEGIRQYCQEVRSSEFPQPEHFYDIEPEELEKILKD